MRVNIENYHQVFFKKIIEEYNIRNRVRDQPILEIVDIYVSEPERYREIQILKEEKIIWKTRWYYIRSFTDNQMDESCFLSLLLNITTFGLTALSEQIEN